MATNKRRPHGTADGIPVKSEHDFLISALKKGADEINYTSRQFTQALGMVHPTRGATVYFGQAMEITFLLNHATKRCIELLEAVNEDNPNAQPDADPVPVRVTKAPPIEDQPDPATIFGGEKARRAAEDRVRAKKDKRRKEGK